MRNLNKKIGEMEYDGLIADLTPCAEVHGGTIAALDKETQIKRGTILAKSASDGKLYVLGTEAASGDTLTPDSILCDDVIVGTSDDMDVLIYTAGCFNTNKVIVADGYTITADDIDQLRKYSIVFKAEFTN